MGRGGGGGVFQNCIVREILGGLNKFFREVCCCFYKIFLSTRENEVYFLPIQVSGCSLFGSQ